MDCRNCNECRISRTKGIIYCREGHWVYDHNLSERRLKLTDNEIRGYRINNRKQFLMANKCRDFVNYIE